MSEESEDGRNHHEIITLQVGNYANYVGAHYFNLQDPSVNWEEKDEVDSNILWSQHVRGGKAIWAPRVLIFDLKDNYTETSWQSEESIPGRDESELEQVRQGVLWQGDVKCIDLSRSNARNSSSSGASRETKAATNAISRGGNEGRNVPLPLPAAESKRNISDQVKSWTDFASSWKLRVPESSRFTVPNFSHNPNLGVLSNYGQGLEIYKGLEEKVADSIRLFAEASDYFQGFHILADQCDGFAGLASGVLEHISDEYDKKTSFSVGLSRPDVSGGNEQWRDFMLRTLNTIFSWNAFSLHSSMFTSLGLSTDLFSVNPTPLRLPHLNYNPSSAFESSSVLAAALDTLMMPCRRKCNGMSLPELASLLNAYGHKMSVVGSAFPFPLQQDGTLFDALKAHRLESSLLSLTPGTQVELEGNIGNFFVTRGFRPDQVIRRREGDIYGRGITNAESCVELYSQETCRKSVNVVRSGGSPLKLSHPFPVLFDASVLETVGKKGVTTSVGPGGGGVRRSEVWEVPTIASAHNATSSVGNMLQRMIDTQEKARGLLRSGEILKQMLDVELDDYDDCINNLRTLRDAYNADS